MRVLVTGYNGQLGYDVVKELTKRNIECIGTTRSDFDITDFAAAEQFITEYAPDVVIHCAAYTAVDRAEDDADNCYLVNSKATENIAVVCHNIAAKLVYISTDYVFPGAGEQFYEPADQTGPLGVYGKSKLLGEQAVQRIIDKYFIVRISWVFGKNGNNFIKTMLRLAESHSELRVVGDQIGSPTYTADVAVLLCSMITSDRYGVYHATNEGVCSWAELASEVFYQTGKAVKVTAIPSSEYPTRATRPLNSRMSKACLIENGFTLLPKWQDAVKRYIKEIM